MVRPPALPPTEKVRIVLSLMTGEIAVAEAARRAKVSKQSVGTGSANSWSPAVPGLLPGSPVPAAGNSNWRPR